MNPYALLLSQDMSDEEFEKRLKMLEESRKLGREIRHNELLIRMKVQEIELEIQQRPSPILKFLLENQDDN